MWPSMTKNKSKYFINDWIFHGIHITTKYLSMTRNKQKTYFAFLNKKGDSSGIFFIAPPRAVK